ncbi:conserved exported hypothetical protein [uncultured Alphaproteobacteria bacterium]|uniref:Lipoprotein n=1 Tax=uncultured Alphaproteobacteria bacterium TaxID=91750 RepID=A0A212K8G2_9PROT|nr:conserved exported hypothetical protein [uncultured Alphaproteobacteria bacterium]
MSHIRFALALVAALAAAPALALDAPEGIFVNPTEKGEVLANAERMTLYTFLEDPQNQSVCIGGCAESWPPALAPEDARPVGEFSLVKREDGARQWAYRGKPLYAWVQDRNPGDTSGDGVGGKWTVAKP